MAVDERMKAAAEEFGEKDVDKFQTWLFTDVLPMMAEIEDPTECAIPHFDNPVDELKYYKMLEVVYAIKIDEMQKALNERVKDILSE